ncbi:hypothetical protein GTR04_6208 [Trichophyton interdigitale]|nr:hypothetical protein GY632_6061 [Trichophyton interdigitale]KAG8206413.1 hypothetical protein GTR04_6208 [Trichophyton interdigitale]
MKLKSMKENIEMRWQREREEKEKEEEREKQRPADRVQPIVEAQSCGGRFLELTDYLEPRLNWTCSLTALSARATATTSRHAVLDLFHVSSAHPSAAVRAQADSGEQSESVLTRLHTPNNNESTDKRRRSRRRTSRLDQPAVGWLRTPSAVINSGSPSALVSLLAATPVALVRPVRVQPWLRAPAKGTLPPPRPPVGDRFSRDRQLVQAGRPSRERETKKQPASSKPDKVARGGGSTWVVEAVEAEDEDEDEDDEEACKPAESDMTLTRLLLWA